MIRWDVVRIVNYQRKYVYFQQDVKKDKKSHNYFASLPLLQ
jgi:hypothetical protein